MRYKIHFAKGTDPAKAWVIEELPSKDNLYPRSFYVPNLIIRGTCEFMPQDNTATPSGWAEAEGILCQDGSTNTFMIVNTPVKELK